LAGQVGTKDLSPIYAPHKLVFMKNMNFVKISAGFQHSMFLTDEGEVYGCGKSDKLQLGEEYLKSYNEAKTFKDVGMGVQKLHLNLPQGERIVDISAGKYHSALLTSKIFL
jgi:alpha-tubulin suppressor-like RCC1 family protein